MVLDFDNVIRRLELRILSVDAEMLKRERPMERLQCTKTGLERQLSYIYHLQQINASEHDLMQWSMDVDRVIVAGMYGLTHQNYDPYRVVIFEFYLHCVAGHDRLLALRWALFDIEHSVGLDRVIANPDLWMGFVERETQRLQADAYIEFAWKLFRGFLTHGLLDEALGFGFLCCLFLFDHFGSEYEANTFYPQYLEFLHSTGQSTETAFLDEKADIYYAYLDRQKALQDMGFRQ